MLAFILLALTGCASRQVNVLVYNMHAGADAAGVPNLDRVAACLLAETGKMAARPLPTKELARVKEQMKGHLVLGLEGTGARMQFNAVNHFYLGRVPGLDELLAKIEAVSAAEVQALARKLFACPPAIAAIGPAGDYSPLQRRVTAAYR